MNLAGLSQAIYDRITGDTGDGGLMETDDPLINAIYEDVILTGASVPYVIVSIVETEEDDTFPTDAWLVTFELEVVCDRRLGDYTTDSAILARAHTQLHRWVPTVTGYAVQDMRSIAGTTDHTLTERHWITRYRTRMEAV